MDEQVTSNTIVIEEGRLWSFLRYVLERGRDIQAAYVGGSESYEHLSARVDLAARELSDKFTAKFGAPSEPPAGPNVAEEISAGIRHDYGDQAYTLPERDLVAMTVLLDEHPEWWDHPCLCAECRTHG